MDRHDPGTVYLDCAATTPIEAEVLAAMSTYFELEYGNAGSRTHDYGLVAQRAVQAARQKVGEVVGLGRENVVFTSGATESNNLAILGFEQFARRHGLKHVVTSHIEHKAVLEPFELLEERGFEVSRLPPDADGAVSAAEVLNAVRPETALISIMHVNNETGVIQPVSDIAQGLADSQAYLHVDAAQSFGKFIPGLDHPRIDLISISGHKVYGPKGIGALLMRSRNYQVPPIAPIMVGGGQEQGLRPGTLPVPLVVGLGKAAELATRDHEARSLACLQIRNKCEAFARTTGAKINGGPTKLAPQIMNLSFNGISSEATMIALKGVAAISNGSACTSSNYEPSHVLKAMGLPDDDINGAVRLSWSHLTPQVDWERIEEVVRSLS